MIKGKLFDKALSIVRRLNESGFTAYFAGGAVRDMIMGVEPDDYDIATDARVSDISRLFRRVIPVGAQFGVSVVIIGGDEFQVATFRSDGEYSDGRHPDKVSFSSPEEDALRRDFTINGLFYDPLEDKVIDYVGGIDDIERGIIRAIGEPEKRFAEDRLRMLRAVRFSSRFGFPIERNTLAAVKKNASFIKDVSYERIRDELVKILTCKSPASGLWLMDDTGLLCEILPEVCELKGVEQPPEFHPEGDVFTHTLLMLEKLSRPPADLVFAALFHDIGKPKTLNKKTLKTPCHGEVGYYITKKVLRRLKFSNDFVDRVSWAVKNHMNFMHVQKMRIGKLKRLMGRDTFQMELELHKVDCLASHGMLDNYYFLIEKEKEFALEDLKPKPFLNGHDIIALGLAPGPLFKDILDEAWTLQLENKFSGREDALAWLADKVKEVK